MKHLDFYFDFLSPYSFFAFTKHKEYLEGHATTVTYKPVLMGKLFSHHEFRGPGDIPAKRAYELKKCFRIASQLNIDFHPPHTFPFNPLAIIRLATKHASSDQTHFIIEKVFKLIWQNGLILEDPEIILRELKKEGVSQDVFDRSFEKEAKLELKQNIKEALSLNIFGVPTINVKENNEWFWGFDSLHDLSTFLAENDKWDRQLYNNLLNKKN